MGEWDSSLFTAVSPDDVCSPFIVPETTKVMHVHLGARICICGQSVSDTRVSISPSRDLQGESESISANAC